MTPRKKTSEPVPARQRKRPAPAAQIIPPAPAKTPQPGASVAGAAPRERRETPEERQRRIAARAYARFLARGGEHGSALEDWLEAERQIQAEERRRP